jgi:SOS response regulatory protein OraA/RecX
MQPDKEALHAALKLLKNRDYLSSELDLKLENLQYSKEIRVTVLEFLMSRGLLNDTRTINNTIARNSGKSAIGRYKLQAKLASKGLPEEKIEDALSSWSEEEEREALRELLTLKMVSEENKAKVFRFAVSRGFDPEMVETEIERLIES